MQSRIASPGKDNAQERATLGSDSLHFDLIWHQPKVSTKKQIDDEPMKGGLRNAEL